MSHGDGRLLINFYLPPEIDWAGYRQESSIDPGRPFPVPRDLGWTVLEREAAVRIFSDVWYTIKYKVPLLAGKVLRVWMI